jgi:hypothetical protein
MKENKKYKMLQLDEEVHKLLKEYCQHHGFQLKGFVQAMIKQTIAKNKRK